MKLAESHRGLFLPCSASDHELLFLRDVSRGGPCGGWNRSLSTEGIRQGATTTAGHQPGSSLPSGVHGQPGLPVGFTAPWHVGTKSSPATAAAMAAMPTPIALFSPKVPGLLPVLCRPLLSLTPCSAWKNFLVLCSCFLFLAAFLTRHLCSSLSVCFPSLPFSLCGRWRKQTEPADQGKAVADTGWFQAWGTPGKGSGVILGRDLAGRGEEAWGTH